MLFIVATNSGASQTPKHRPTGTPLACATFQIIISQLDEYCSNGTLQSVIWLFDKFGLSCSPTDMSVV